VTNSDFKWNGNGRFRKQLFSATSNTLSVKSSVPVLLISLGKTFGFGSVQNRVWFARIAGKRETKEPVPNLSAKHIHGCTAADECYQHGQLLQVSKRFSEQVKFFVTFDQVARQLATHSNVFNRLLPHRTQYKYCVGRRSRELKVVQLSSASSAPHSGFGVTTMTSNRDILFVMS